MELLLACLFCLLVGINIGVIAAFKIIKSNPAIIASPAANIKPQLVNPAIPRKV